MDKEKYFSLINSEIKNLLNQYKSKKTSEDEKVAIKFEIGLLKKILKYPKYVELENKSHDEIVKEISEEELSEIKRIVAACGEDFPAWVSRLFEAIVSSGYAKEGAELLTEYNEAKDPKEVNPASNWLPSAYALALTKVLSVTKSFDGDKLLPVDKYKFNNIMSLYIESSLYDSDTGMIKNFSRITRLFNEAEEALVEEIKEYIQPSDIDKIHEAIIDVRKAFCKDESVNDIEEYIRQNVDDDIDFDVFRRHTEIYKDYHIDEYLKSLLAEKAKLLKKLIKTSKDKERLVELDTQIVAQKVMLYNEIYVHYESIQNRVIKKYDENVRFKPLTKTDRMNPDSFILKIQKNIDTINSQLELIKEAKEKVSLTRNHQESDLVKKEILDKLIKLIQRLASEDDFEGLEEFLETMPLEKTSNGNLNFLYRLVAQRRVYYILENVKHQYTFIQYMARKGKEADTIVEQMSQGVDVLDTGKKKKASIKEKGYIFPWLLALMTEVITCGIVILGIMMLK